MIKPAFVSLGTPPRRPQAPFAAFDDGIVEIIEKAICEAWRRLKTSTSLDLTSASEKAITTELQESIVDVLNDGNVDGFVPEIFAQPVRDASVVDYSGKYLEKKPDLTFHIQSAAPLSPNKGYFFECKPIGNVSTYLGRNGLERFCDGRYAWAMPHAGMIGYVQRKTSPLTAQDAIEEHVNNKTLVVNSHYGDTTATYHPIWVTIHSRDFALLNGNAPGPILIRHVWLAP